MDSSVDQKAAYSALLRWEWRAERLETASESSVLDVLSVTCGGRRDSARE